MSDQSSFESMGRVGLGFSVNLGEAAAVKP